MDIWSLIYLILKISIYLVVFGTIGTELFYLHFNKILTDNTKEYCFSLKRKTAFSGVILSLITFLFVAGSFGGNLANLFNPIILKLAGNSKAGYAALIMLTGFFFIILSSKKLRLISKELRFLGILLILLSFNITGHASNNGIVSQAFLNIHLIGISYWLGALLPLKHICIKPFPEEKLYKIAHNFGVYATGYVIFLLIAGAGLGYLLLEGNIQSLLTSSYGNILLLKISAVTVLLSVGAFNKIRLVPLLKKNLDTGAKKLNISINTEIILVFIIIIMTSLLTTSIALPI